LYNEKVGQKSIEQECMKGESELRIQRSITINQPIERVFALLSDLEQSGGWETHSEKEELVTYHFLGFPIKVIQQLPGFFGIRKISAGPLGVGTTFVQTTTRRGISTEDLIEITEYEPPNIVTFIQTKPLRSEFRWVLKAVDRGTKVTVTLHVEMFWLIGLFAASSAKKELEKYMTRLKERQEAI